MDRVDESMDRVGESMGKTEDESMGKITEDWERTIWSWRELIV